MILTEDGGNIMLTASYFKEIENTKALFRVNGSFDELIGDVITE